MPKAVEALGIIETRSYIALVEAADTMLKTAMVSYLGWDKIGSGLVSVFVTGDVASVKAATDAGAEAAAKVGQVVNVQVLPYPDEDLAAVLPISVKKLTNWEKG
ncbi:MAG: BMC domain-containing protein [Pirellulaceae bacterium]|nr:BMC domain-containing protein [Pirellulaceae bacterium]